MATVNNTAGVILPPGKAKRSKSKNHHHVSTAATDSSSSGNNTNNGLVWNLFSRMKATAHAESPKQHKSGGTLFQSRRRRERNSDANTPRVKIAVTAGGTDKKKKIPRPVAASHVSRPTPAPAARETPSSSAPPPPTSPVRDPIETLYSTSYLTPLTQPSTPDDDNVVVEMVVEPATTEAAAAPRALFSVPSLPSPPRETVQTETTADNYDDDDDDYYDDNVSQLQESVEPTDDTGAVLIFDRKTTKSSDVQHQQTALPWDSIGQAIGALLTVATVYRLASFLVRALIRLGTNTVDVVVSTVGAVMGAGVAILDFGVQSVAFGIHQVLWCVLLTGYYYLAWRKLPAYYDIASQNKNNDSMKELDVLSSTSNEKTILIIEGPESVPTREELDANKTGVVNVEEQETLSPAENISTKMDAPPVALLEEETEAKEKAQPVMVEEEQESHEPSPNETVAAPETRELEAPSVSDDGSDAPPMVEEEQEQEQESIELAPSETLAALETIQPAAPEPSEPDVSREFDDELEVEEEEEEEEAPPDVEEEEESQEPSQPETLAAAPEESEPAVPEPSDPDISRESDDEPEVEEEEEEEEAPPDVEEEEESQEPSQPETLAAAPEESEPAVPELSEPDVSREFDDELEVEKEEEAPPDVEEEEESQELGPSRTLAAAPEESEPAVPEPSDPDISRESDDEPEVEKEEEAASSAVEEEEESHELGPSRTLAAAPEESEPAVPEPSDPDISREFDDESEVEEEEEAPPDVEEEEESQEPSQPETLAAAPEENEPALPEQIEPDVSRESDDESKAEEEEEEVSPTVEEVEENHELAPSGTLTALEAIERDVSTESEAEASPVVEVAQENQESSVMETLASLNVFESDIPIQSDDESEPEVEATLVVDLDQESQETSQSKTLAGARNGEADALTESDDETDVSAETPPAFEEDQASQEPSPSEILAALETSEPDVWGESDDESEVDAPPMAEEGQTLMSLGSDPSREEPKVFVQPVVLEVEESASESDNIQRSTNYEWSDTKHDNPTKPEVDQVSSCSLNNVSCRSSSSVSDQLEFAHEGSGGRDSCTEGANADEVVQTPRRKVNNTLNERLQIFQKSNPSNKAPWDSFSDSSSNNLDIRKGSEDLAPPMSTPRKSPAGSKFLSSKNALIEALTTPTRNKPPLTEAERTPRTLKRGFVAMNIASPRKQAITSPTPPKRFTDDAGHSEKHKAGKYIDAALKVLQDRSREAEVEALIRRIEVLGGFPSTRRLSMRDNELVSRLVMAVRNDPRITEVHADASVFGTISSLLLGQFIEGLRINLHVKSLSLQGVELGNDFLYTLAGSLESNFVIEQIDLSLNCFTSEGLANFCQSVATNNESLKTLNLKNQTTPISIASEEDVLDAFRESKILTHVQLDFQSEDGPKKLEEILERNRAMDSSKTLNLDSKLIGALEYEADRAQEVWQTMQDNEIMEEEASYDWEYMYELATLFDKHKLKKEVEDYEKAPAERRNADDLSALEKKNFLFGAFKKTMEESVSCFNSDGSFLTDEFIAKYLKENQDEGTLNFDFHGQWKLFRRFPMHDPARELIVDKFVGALVSHPRASELTSINMAATGCGDDFVVRLCERCVNDSALLPNIHSVNFETNFINETGVVALSQLIASPKSCRYIQVIRLENQKSMLKSKAEFALAKALRVNRSIVVVSLRVRNLLERERIGKYILRNVDYLRQARQRHLKTTGVQRKRNAVEEIFDKICKNEDSITTVYMSGNKRFLTLTREEKLKAASSLATNSHVKEVIFNACAIDDEFAVMLGQTFRTNSTIEKVCLESNEISGRGVRALFEGLKENRSVRELRLHKQTKVLPSADEDMLADILEGNTTLVKLGIDLRSKMAQVLLDRKISHNQKLVIKERALAKGEEYTSSDAVASIKL